MRGILTSLPLLLLLSHCSQPQAPVAPAPPQPAKLSMKPPARPQTVRTMMVHRMNDGEGTLYMPGQLCYLDEVIPGIKVDLRYCGNENFTGRPIAGYTTGRRAILRKDMAERVKCAQEALAAKGLGLLVWDAYRPHRAMQDIYAWSRTPEEGKKAEYYPNITKRGIYENRYIGRYSAHSQGAAIDVTIIDLSTGKQLDMGSDFDFLDTSSATRYTGITPEQHANRMLLRNTMRRAGLINYKREWWHYFLRKPVNPVRYNFPLCDTLIPKP